MAYSCSIIIPTHNRVTSLKQCITSLLAQTGVDFEIIVVNDGSSDETHAYLESLDDDRITAIHHAQSQGPSNARNAGIAQAQHDIICFIDDDCIADPNWALSLGSAFQGDTAFVIGETIYREKGYTGYFPERLVQNHNAHWPMSCNIAFKKSVLEKEGGFNAEYDQYHNEDSELAIRLVSRGYTYARSTNAVVFHQAQLWTIDSLLASARNASVWVRLKKEYPEHYMHFGPSVTQGLIVNIEDYVYFLFLKLLIIILFIRYLYHGKRDIGIFFIKWPVWLILRRVYIYKEAWKHNMWMF